MNPQNLIENPFIPYSFNGMEKDNEVKGEGNSYTTFFRQNDPRLGRWMSIDPVLQPWQSTYSSMDNNPTANNDVRGDKVKVGKKKEEPVKPEKPASTGDMEGVITTYNSEDLAKYEAATIEYEKVLNEVKEYNKQIDYRVETINKSLNGWSVVYNEETGEIEPAANTNKREVKKMGGYDASVLKAINSSSTLTISTSYLITGADMKDRQSATLNIPDFEKMYSDGNEGKVMARSQLAGVFAQFNTGNEYKALEAEIQEIVNGMGYQVSAYFPFSASSVKDKKHGGKITYKDNSNSKTDNLGIIFEYDINTGNIYRYSYER